VRLTRTVLICALLLAGAQGVAPAAALLGLCDTGELFASSDNGITWAVTGTLPVRDAVALAAMLTRNDLYLVSRSGGVYRSVDAGQDWVGIGSIAASDLVDLAVTPAGSLYVLTASGWVYESVDHGESFAARGGVTESDCTSLVLDAGGSLQLLTRTGALYRSDDAGSSWGATATVPVPDAVRLRRLGGDLVLLTESGDVAVLGAGGGEWSIVGSLSQIGMRGMVSANGNLFVATREGHIASSGDGSGWTWQGSINQLTLAALASDEPAVAGVEEPTVHPGFAVGPAWPNPVRSGVASIPIRILHPGMITLSVLDVAGRVVSRNAAEPIGIGDREIAWAVDGFGAGLYWIRLSMDGREIAKQKFTVLR
jgi:photosystem II stability/assembly factor-like uncharacterized protein